jgi:hypothetical protein
MPGSSADYAIGAAYGRITQMVAAKQLRRPGIVAMASFLLLSFAGTVSGIAATGSPNAMTLSGMNRSSCRQVHLTAAFEVTYDERSAGYSVDAATVRGLDAATADRCAGVGLDITLSDATGRPLSEAGGVVPGSAGTFTVDLTGVHVAASDVASMQLTVSG